MSTKEFVVWLRGFFSCVGGQALTDEQWEIIEEQRMKVEMGKEEKKEEVLMVIGAAHSHLGY